jgi:hypothetical protein
VTVVVWLTVICRVSPLATGIAHGICRVPTAAKLIANRVVPARVAVTFVLAVVALMTRFLTIRRPDDGPDTTVVGPAATDVTAPVRPTTG